MRPRNLSLGLKLNLTLLLFLLVLGGATAAITLYGFRRTEDNATGRSRRGLEDLAKDSSLYFARSQASLGVLQLEFASQAGQEAARYMVDAKGLGMIPSWDSNRLVRGTNGQLTDPTADRRTDIYIPTTAELNDAAQADLRDSAGLDVIFPALAAHYPGIVRSEDFNATAIYFQSVNRVTRYYPPTGTLDRAPPNLDATPGLQLAGPAQNPQRKTVWSTPRIDVSGQGLVMTAWSPVYEGPNYRGVIGVDLSLAKLVEQVNDSKATPGGFSFYIDKTGVLLRSAAYDVMDRATHQDNPALTAVVAQMNNGESGVGRVQIDGRDVFIAYAPLEFVGGSFGVVSPVDEAVAQSTVIETSINEESNRTIGVTLVVLGIIFIAAMAIAGWLNRKVLLRPIEALVAGTRSVAAGDLDTMIDVRGEDEMALMARSFNEMTSDLRERRDALRQEVSERQKAQDELRALLGGMTDVVLTIDSSGRYLTIPKTNAPEVLQPRENLIGKTLYEVMPQEQADLFMKPVHEALASGQTVTFEYPQPAEGRTLWLSIAVSPMAADQVVVVARDITDRVNASQELERQVEERTRQLTTILQVSRQVGSTLELAPLLRTIIDQVRSVADYDRSSIFLLQDDALVMFSSRVPEGDSTPDYTLRFYLSDIGPIWERLSAKQAVIVDDVKDDSPAAQAYRRASGEELIKTALKDIRSWVGVPLVVRERIIGMLTISSNTPGFYNQQHVDVVSAIASQAAIAIENAQLYEQAQQLAATEERQRLARELHDSVSQALYGIALGARTARTLLDRDPIQAIQPVDYVLSLAEAGLAEMRALIFELRPESLQIEGLVVALDKQIAATGARYGITVTAELGEEPDVSLTTKEVFYRVGQEALHNVVKHAHASRVDVRLTRSGDMLALEVIDDGVGFDSSGSFPGHMGLVSMSERAGSIGARLKVMSAPGRGTAVRLELRLVSEARQGTTPEIGAPSR